MPKKEKGFYGVGHTKCPRCEKGMQSHEVNSCDITEATYKGVQQLISAARSVAGQQGGLGEIGDRMVGALIAVTSTGKTIKLTAVSGPVDEPPRVSGWTGADISVPRTRSGWIDVYGRSFALPSTVPIGNACAAIKLLMKLGELRRDSRTPYGYSSISFYEEAVRAPEAKTDHKGRVKKGKSTKLASWRGEGHTFVYAAHSCDECRQRIPLLLCSNATDN